MTALQIAFPRPDAAASNFGSRICGTGPMAELFRDHDWSRTPLGPIGLWPQALLTSVNLMLNSPTATSLYWGPRQVLLYNDGYRQFMGPRHPASLGRPGAEVWKEAWHIVGPEIEQTFRTGERFQGKAALVPIERDGLMQDFFWDYTFSPIFDEGHVVGVYNTCVDVTASIHTTRERDSLAARLRQALESTSDGVVSIDRNWCFTYMNERARRAARFPPDIIGKNLWQSLPNLPQQNVDHYRRAMDQCQPGEFESFYPDPLNHWVHMQVRPSPEGIVLFLRDITEEKRAAAAAQEAEAARLATEEELRWIVAMSAQLPWTADPEGMITGNSGDLLKELTGYSNELALGNDWINLVEPGDAKRMEIAWAYSVRTGEPYDIEHRQLKTDGGFHWFRSRALPRRDAAGDIVKWYGNSEDINARKQAEEALRTTEKLAAVGRLAATMAHEINNPLEAVTNLLYLARVSEPLPPNILEYIQAAERELHRASVISNQTLRFHRQSGKPSILDCAEMIPGVLAAFRGRLTNFNIATIIDLGDTPPIECFDGEIRQVFLNLVGNAIDAMRSTGGKLRIRTRAATHWPTGRGGLTLIVADTGPGMSPETCSKIFKPFFTTKGINGTGLGLWVSQEIIARHHGELRLRTTQGTAASPSGTVFTLFLPCNKA